MTQHLLHTMGVVLVAIATFTSATAEEGTTADRSSDEIIPVSNFGRNNVIGHLGHPLGTIVRVTGNCVDGSATRRRADEGKTLLKITTVNGTKLKQPFIVPFLRAAKEIKKPAPGDRFDFYAHEWGEFDGIVHVPEGLGVDQPMVANDGFYYRPQIAIHKANPLASRSTLQPKRTEANPRLGR